MTLAKILIWLNKYYRNERKTEWLQRQTNWKSNKLKENLYIGDMLVQRFMVMFDGNKYNVRNKNKQMRDQLKFLKQYEAEIIIGLRSEYINLNGFKNFVFNETNGKCICCNMKETVEHYLLKCQGSLLRYYSLLVLVCSLILQL